MLLIKTLRYVTYINSNLLTIQLLLPFFFKEEDRNFINQSWQNSPELHCRYVVEHPPSTRQNLRHFLHT